MSANNADRLLVAVEEYYTTKLIEHGANPNGVDWNGKESQVLRLSNFVSLSIGIHLFRLMILVVVMGHY